jgi:hypothetical protein
VTQNRKDVIVVMVAAGLLAIGLFLSSLCTPVKAEDICTYTFSQEQTSTITMCMEELQQCRGLATSLNAITEKQDEKISDLTMANTKYKEAVDAQDKAIEALKQVSLEKDNLRTMEKQQCDKKIEEAKPKLKDKAVWFSAGVLTTIITAVVAILAL